MPVGTGLECVLNVSEGRRATVVTDLSDLAGDSLLDVHTDPWHHRSVLTLGGAGVSAAAKSVARRAVELLDLSDHAGVHPRLGVVDVVPFVPLPDTAGEVGSGGPLSPVRQDLEEACAARDDFAQFAAFELGVPCFLYGPTRSLPEVRRNAFNSLAPDLGPPRPHPTAGAICVGARHVLVAYNLWLAIDDLELARQIALELRSAEVRTLALEVGGRVQVSCNILQPLRATPASVFDFVAARAPIARAELVGLVPASLLDVIAPDRWPELDLGEDRTIESRLRAATRPRHR